MVQRVKPREPLGGRPAWGVCFQTAMRTSIIVNRWISGLPIKFGGLSRSWSNFFWGVGSAQWINEIPTVPIYYLAKPQPRERAWQNQRGKKTLLSLTLV